MRLSSSFVASRARELIASFENRSQQQLLAELATARALLASRSTPSSSSSATATIAHQRALASALDSAEKEKAEAGSLRREVEGLRERTRWFDERVREKEKQFVVRLTLLCLIGLRMNCVKIDETDWFSHTHRSCKTSIRLSHSSSRSSRSGTIYSRRIMRSY